MLIGYCVVVFELFFESILCDIFVNRFIFFSSSFCVSAFQRFSYLSSSKKVCNFYRFAHFISVYNISPRIYFWRKQKTPLNVYIMPKKLNEWVCKRYEYGSRFENYIRIELSWGLFQMDGVCWPSRVCICINLCEKTAVYSTNYSLKMLFIGYYWRSILIIHKSDLHSVFHREGNKLPCLKVVI